MRNLYTTQSDLVLFVLKKVNNINQRNSLQLFKTEDDQLFYCRFWTMEMNTFPIKYII